VNSPLLLSRRAALGTLALPLAGCVRWRRPAVTTADGSPIPPLNQMTALQSPFGSLPDGREVHFFTLRNARGSTLKFTNYGLIVTELHVPDRRGRLGNVVLGFDHLPRYLQGHPFFGAVAGRYANRIAGGQFALDGQTYRLATNNGPNHLHGGQVGFDKRLWTPGALRVEKDSLWAELAYVSPDGEEGYPGELHVTVRYTLTNDDEFRIEYKATTDKPTVLNLTNHSYFNLAGQGDVFGHALEIMADQFTEVDAGLIPTGKLLAVKGTALDFTTPRKIGERAAQGGLSSPGYDHNFVLRSGGKKLALAARAFDPASGRVLECHTDQPGVQLWTMNFDPGPDLVCTGGWKVPRHGGFCLETQHYPDSPNHPHFPSTVLRPGQTFRSTTAYRFSARPA
jgi:aldose 1-epimerase